LNIELLYRTKKDAVAECDVWSRQTLLKKTRCSIYKLQNPWVVEAFEKWGEGI